ncbi:hypothetical protein [Streptomyces sp. NBC_00272]|uniref:hypothetical protein n=1 Tax=Streptomyces sp. NBC_00272 TaxID=2975698 RepID=UPI002E2ABE53|nr:hypothetical protein [Streptomyces sp. NBC_00272]
MTINSTESRWQRLRRRLSAPAVPGPGGTGAPFPALPPEASWHRTGTSVFPYAARVEGRWWILRLNDFPEHPLYTLFVDSRCVADVNDDPADWRRVEAAEATAPFLGAAARAEVLQLMAGLGPYGAEYGTPCTGNDYCTCEVLTDAYAARDA